MTSSPQPDNQRPYWFVGAYLDGTDETEGFIKEGIWEHNFEDNARVEAQVNAMRPGDRIAIKSTNPRDSFMCIKAVGTVKRNLRNGCRIEVDWTPVKPWRKWYFYIYRPTIWRVQPGSGTRPWAADALIRFAFEGEPQDYGLFEGSGVKPSSEPEPLEDDEGDTDDPQADLQQLAVEELYFEEASFLEEIETLLEEKKQVIFQGPPGTGKTHVARAFAKHLAGSEERVTFVQFHPSYAYEDFVQGFRPVQLSNGQTGFELRDGPLVWAANQARDEQQRAEDAGEEPPRHFLLIDEINRGNLGKVFGELYFLLEYRDEKIRLQYQEEDAEPFSLPENLYIIGTMNTADRSIALVDLALRRRFSFVEFDTREEPIKGLLRRWLEKNAPGMEWVAGIVDAANERLDDRHAAIGPSYFMKPGLTEERAERVWKHDVLPYIEERLYGQRDRLGEFDFDTLRSGGTGESAAEQSDADAGDEDDGEGDASD